MYANQSVSVNRPDRSTDHSGNADQSVVRTDRTEQLTNNRSCNFSKKQQAVKVSDLVLLGFCETVLRPCNWDRYDQIFKFFKMFIIWELSLFDKHTCQKFEVRHTQGFEVHQCISESDSTRALPYRLSPRPPITLEVMLWKSNLINFWNMCGMVWCPSKHWISSSN